MPQPWKLSPSELTFLWDECPRCFYLKVVCGVARPATPMPGVFQRIDRLMKDHFRGRPAAEVSPTLPPGVVRVDERWVTSAPIQPPGRSVLCFLKGRCDALLQFDDGSWGIIDFKTSEPKQEQVAFYSRQLHAYAYALEHPQPGVRGLAPVTRLGLLVVNPDRLLPAGDRLAYAGPATWLECPKAEGLFLDFLDRVLELLEQPEPPPAAERCAWCQYRALARSSGL